MRGFQATALIPLPADEVWRQLTRWPDAPKWMSGIDTCRGPEPPVQGERIAFLARGAERESTLTEVVKNERLVLESKQSGVTAVYRYQLQPEGEGTRVTLDASCTAEGPIRLMMPLIRFMMKRVDGGQPEALARLMSGGGG
jgi:uncharacterized protein YndB with AHSA1/START domain